MSVYANQLLPSKDLPQLNNPKKALLILDQTPESEDEMRSLKQISAVRSILRHHKGLLTAGVIDKLIAFLSRMSATNSPTVQKHSLTAVNELVLQVPAMKQSTEL